MNNIPRQYVIVGAVVLALVVIIGGLFVSRRNNQQKQEAEDTVFEEPVDVIPTVDSSVQVEIEGNKEAVITISGIPDGTDMIEYELSYDTESGGLQGVLGMIQVKSGEDTAEDEVTFGTCSSGVCRYHEIKGPVSGTFKFSGEYGERLLEKDFDLE